MQMGVQSISVSGVRTRLPALAEALTVVQANHMLTTGHAVATSFMSYPAYARAAENILAHSRR